MAIETKYNIGDVVYFADQYKYDKDIIKGLKVLGVGGKVTYGIKDKGGNYWPLFGSSGDGYSWYKANEIFSTEEEAKNQHEKLAAVQKAKDEEEKATDRKKRLDELNREREALESGKEYEPDYSDD